jgi:hypothetical protein
LPTPSISAEGVVMKSSLKAPKDKNDNPSTVDAQILINLRGKVTENFETTHPEYLALLQMYSKSKIFRKDQAKSIITRIQLPGKISS